MKKMQYLAFILVAVILNACSDKFIEMKKSPCALNAPTIQGGLYV
ncbi:type IV secretion system protein VirB7 [Helicobacter pylori]|nr:type IV secretion system protein VirB7 [Helicobacter pylori]OOQ34241.1 type IV secretion system protein VirB7 [Helicobacter pylori]PDW28758.1 type IV secretion system protein VirB7 [Helicobacter pylori]PDW35223.1 type IV secretion system protein VirB7 [Helicobacter pylori]PDX12350.1 type IV secretion system protein VirB7 [Helicobacter pylori]